MLPEHSDQHQPDSGKLKYFLPYKNESIQPDTGIGRSTQREAEVFEK